MIGFDPKLIEDKGGQVYYNGKHIGYYHQVTNYPAKAHSLDKQRHGSFRNLSEAYKALAVWAGVLGTPCRLKDVFPTYCYILRVSQIDLLCDPNPEYDPQVSVRLYYNTFNTFGSSEASKPCTSEICILDLKSKRFLTKKPHVFMNEVEIIEKILAMIKEIV